MLVAAKENLRVGPPPDLGSRPPPLPPPPPPSRRPPPATSSRSGTEDQRDPPSVCDGISHGLREALSIPEEPDAPFRPGPPRTPPHGTEVLPDDPQVP